jgi:predicted enzyme related to lactoylglutathione lyase
VSRSGEILGKDDRMVDVRFHLVVIDCADPRSLAAFWERFTGYERRSDYEDWVSIYAPDGSMRIGFQQVPEGKIVKNRVHLDFAADDEEVTAKEIEALGATRRWVSEDPEDPFVVLADPEGNEFCIVRADPSG